MVVGRRQEGEKKEQKTRNSTDNNGAAKQGQTADKEKKQKRGYFVATACVVPRPLVRQNPDLSLQVSAHDFLYCETFNI